MSLENTLRVLRGTLLYRSFFHVFSIRGIYNFVLPSVLTEASLGSVRGNSIGK